MTKSAWLTGLMVLSVSLLAVIGTTDISWGATPHVKAGGNHTVVLKSDGSLWGWGENTFGQVGDGTLISRNVPARIGTDITWSAISAGIYHTVALKSDGSLWAWGDNTKGQLGMGLTAYSQPAPVRIGTDTNWVEIASGDFHTLARKSDGSLWAWGDNSSGQVGNGSVVPGIQTVPVRIGNDIDWGAIAAGGSHSVALKGDHTLWGWGSNAAGQLGNGNAFDAVLPVKITLPSPFTYTDWNVVAAGQNHTAALKTDGSLWSWGSNIFGQLGNGTTLNSNLPAPEASNATNWVAIAAGDFHALGRKTDGTLWTWGGNANGQLGIGTNLDAPAPVKIGTDTDWIDVASGSLHSVALKTNGTVWCWGENNFGQTGDGTNIPKNAPVQCAAAPATGATITPSQPNPHTAGTSVVFTAAGQGSTNYDYRFLLFNGTSWTLVQDYGNGNNWTLPANTPIGKYVIDVDVRTSSAVDRDTVAYFSYEVTGGPATGVQITPSQPNPHTAGTSVVFTAAGQSSTNYDYRFLLFNGTSWALVQDYGNGNNWTLPANTPIGKYVIDVDVRTSSAVDRDTVAYFSYEVTGGPATGVVITPSQPNPHTAGTSVVFTAAGQGSTNYDYRFLLFNGTSWTLVQDYGNGNSWTLPAATPVGRYVIDVDVRTSSAVDRDTVAYFSYEVTSGPATGVDVTPSQPSPHPQGTAVVFTANGQGSSNYDYRFWLYNGISWALVQNYGGGNTWTLPAATPAGDYVIDVDVRTSVAVDRDAVTYFPYKVQ